MLRRFLLAVTAVAALSFASTASAKTNLGMGVMANVDGSGGMLLVPMQIAPNLKLEPMVAISTYDYGNDTSESAIGLGTGLFFNQKATQTADIYFGGRLLLNFVSWDDGTTDDSGTDFRLSAAVGGEYYLSPKFSVGAEGNLGFFSTSDANLALNDTSGFFTAGYVIVRFYL